MVLIMGLPMLAVAFDTLKLARKLESAGFPPKQAQDASAALAESITEWHSVGNLATREDVLTAKADVQKEMQALRTDMQKLDAKISETKAEILKWMFGAITTQTIIIVGTLVALLHNIGKL
jgi:hypothetical protein